MINGFQAHKIKHHRNGVGGRPFWTVYFSCMLTDYNPPKFMPNMMAVIPSDVPVGLEGHLRLDSETYVIDLNDRDECWRGESFYEHVIAAIDKHTKG
jgi:hypothetical protein